MRNVTPSVNPKLSEAMSLLDYSSKDEFSYLIQMLDVLGYLNTALLQKAVQYLEADRPFSKDGETVVTDLSLAIQNFKTADGINMDIFFSEFGNQSYLTANDLIEILYFITQTAFARGEGFERDTLKLQAWMNDQEKAACFVKLAGLMGNTDEQRPSFEEYEGAGIMGAASFRVVERINFYNKINKETKIHYTSALSGKRELSKGLDRDEHMYEVANALGIEPRFVTKAVGNTTREFLDGVTETQMVNYFIDTNCPDTAILVVDSNVEEGHWRATTQSSANDIVRIMYDKLESGDITANEKGICRFIVIAEQPYMNRMARTVQRAFTLEADRRGSAVRFMVEACGEAISPEVLKTPAGHPLLTRMSSEVVGSAFSERYNDARQLHLPAADWRDRRLMLYRNRDEAFAQATKESAIVHGV